jgi:uncharacterized surface protein with fasciclin (FAS1) repeats
MRKGLFIVLAVVLAGALVGCNGENQDESTGAKDVAKDQAMETKKMAEDKAMEAKKTVMKRDIIDIAVADGRFTTLVTAVKAADLVETLKGEGPFTVFAPTDDAFAKLPAGTVEGLLQDIPTLKNILLYHVVPGKVMAADVVKLKSADTALGKSVAIAVMDDHVMVSTAKVVITDIEASNGVIHVIDGVILPPEK